MGTSGLRVIVVGGAGGMGRWAVRCLAQLGSASVLTVADRDLERAELLCRQVGSPAVPLALDARDGDAMRAAFRDHDVVVNTMGPFDTFVRPIVEAAIDSECDYADIDDDWQPTELLFDLDEAARRAGVRVITGIGGSPGLTNLCAVLAAERLDTVEDLLTGWNLAGARVVEEPEFPSPPASAAMDHWVHQCSMPVRAWVDGAFTSVDPVTRIDLDFPGLGPVHAYTMGHPEPITLPRTFPHIRRSLNLQAGPTWLMDQLQATAADVATGRISVHEGAERMSRVERPAVPEPRSPLPYGWALATGTRGGVPVSVGVYPTAGHPALMGGNTGAPVAVAVELLRRGSITATGVHAPESCINPREFLDLLAPLIDHRLTADDFIRIVESPANNS